MMNPPRIPQSFAFMFLLLRTATILSCVAAFSAPSNINGNANPNSNSNSNNKDSMDLSEMIAQQLNIAFVTGNKMKVNIITLT